MSNSVKRYSVIMLVICLMAMAFMAGCSQNNEAPATTATQAPTTTQAAAQTTAAKAEPYQVSMWITAFGNVTDETWANMGKTFTDKNPGWTAKVQMIPATNREQKMIVAMAANKGPDVLYMNPDILSAFSAQGMMKPIDTYITDEMKNDFRKFALSGCTVTGSLYALPLLTSANPWVYNLDLLNTIGMTESNLPTTYDEFEQMCKSLKAKGIMATYINLGHNPISSGLSQFMWCEGKDLIDPATLEVYMTSDAAKKVITMLKRWYDEGYMPKDAINSRTNADGEFVSGKIAATKMSSSIIKSDAMQKEVKFNWTVGPVLKGNAGQYQVSTIGSLAITKDCKNMDAAFAWIGHVTNAENSKTFNELAGFFPARQSVPRLFTDKKNFDKIYEQFDYYRSEGGSSAERSSSAPIAAQVQAIILGEKTVDQGLADAQKEVQALVDTFKALLN